MAAYSPLTLAQETLSEVKKSGIFRSLGYINGEWVSAQSGKTHSVLNPATGTHVADVPVMGHAETTAAIAAASAAFVPWSATSVYERSRILRAWFDNIVKHTEMLARLMTLEQGKPLAEARGEIGYGAAYVELYAEEAKRAYGDIIPSSFPDRKVLVMQQPVGVVAIITPWNFPVAMITRKVAPALAAGCTVVIKPAELTPLCALSIAELAGQAGVPPGVLNVVVGDAPAIGRTMTESDTVRKLSFTGSTAVGRKLMAAAAPTIKRLSLELGGNAPFLVFDDADVVLAVKGAIACKFRNAGQTCVCANRFLVQDGIHDDFVEALRNEMTRSLIVGNGLAPGVTQGPLISGTAVEKVECHIADAVSKGAKILTGGKRWCNSSSAAGSQSGFTDQFFEPTIIVGATPEMLCFREEVFGPVAPIVRFATEVDGVRLANATEFGLAAYVYSQSSSRAWRIAEQLQSGMVGINESAISDAAAPFGGVKQSGFGREGSRYGLMEYQDMKYICLGGL